MLALVLALPQTLPLGRRRVSSVSALCGSATSGSSRCIRRFLARFLLALCQKRAENHQVHRETALLRTFSALLGRHEHGPHLLRPRKVRSSRALRSYQDFLFPCRLGRRRRRCPECNRPIGSGYVGALVVVRVRNRWVGFAAGRLAGVGGAIAEVPLVSHRRRCRRD